MATVTVASTSAVAADSTAGFANTNNLLGTTTDSSFSTAAPAKSSFLASFVTAANLSAGIPAGSTVTAMRWVANVTLSAVVTGGLFSLVPRKNNANVATTATKSTTANANVTATYTTPPTLAELQGGASFDCRVLAEKGNTNSALTISVDVVFAEVDYTPPPSNPPRSSQISQLLAH